MNTLQPERRGGGLGHVHQAVLRLQAADQLPDDRVSQLLRRNGRVQPRERTGIEQAAGTALATAGQAEEGIGRVMAVQLAHAGAQAVRVGEHPGPGQGGAAVQRMGQRAQQGQEHVRGGGAVHGQHQHIGVAVVEEFRRHGGCVKAVRAGALADHLPQGRHGSLPSAPPGVAVEMPVVAAAALQVEKAAVGPVDGLDGPGGGVGQRAVLAGGGGDAVGVIRQQQAVHRAFRHGVACQQQTAYGGNGLTAAAEHCGNHHQRPQIPRH